MDKLIVPIVTHTPYVTGKMFERADGTRYLHFVGPFGITVNIEAQQVNEVCDIFNRKKDNYG